jgi:[histone H4]-lysine20 N-methyltransferase SETD8
MHECGVFETLDKRGLGVRVLEAVPVGATVLLYRGELLCGKRAIRQREKEHEASDHEGSYMFEFTWKRAAYAIDATTSDDASRYVNHSRKDANLVPKAVENVDRPGMPIIVFKAKRNLVAGEELLFDYGDRRPEVVESFPWLLK